MSIDQQFNTINEKLQQVVKQFARVQKENERLKDELQEHKKKEDQSQQAIEELQQQITILKMASGDLTDKDKRSFEKKINQYIKEIDKTISYLSQ
jgi:hypothetical protein